MMTVAQASAVNVLATYLTGDETSHRQPTFADARDALGELADQANRKLMAGWTGERVREMWTQPNVEPKQLALEEA